MSGTKAMLLMSPETQFCDGNGAPYAAGTIATYIPGTTTPKATWSDWQQTVLNTNPVVLDAAGRCILWADGDYRLILSDAEGNLVWDQVSTTLVSAAMVPVVSAPTLQAARDAMGVTAAIQAETDRAVAAEQGIIASLANYATEAELQAETARAEAAETALQAAIDAETARAKAAETALGQDLPGMRVGQTTTDASGVANVTFSTPFPNSCDGVVATSVLGCWIMPTAFTAAGFACVSRSPAFSAANWQKGPAPFFYIAFGH
jgi:hypothetical protein